MISACPLVCFAIKEEAAPFRKTDAAARAQILLVGMGRANAEKTIRAALAAGRPQLVLTCGFAGGLNPQLMTGDVVFSDDPELEGWGERPREPSPGLSVASPHQSLKVKLLASGAREAKFHFAARVAVTAEEKQALWQKTGADAVEMESEIIRVVCREQNIPSATVRVILDAAGETLPLDFNALMTPDMRLDSGKLALTILKSPGKIAALRRLQKQSRIAAEKLAQVLEAVV